jgi:hypothetical protein
MRKEMVIHLYLQPLFGGWEYHIKDSEIVRQVSCIDLFFSVKVGNVLYISRTTYVRNCTWRGGVRLIISRV